MEFRIALIGFGAGGAFFHAPLIAATPGLRLAAIVTSDPVRATNAARTYPNVSILPRTEDIWRRPQDFDLVVIATPNATHVAFAQAALDVGLSIVIDKPIAPTAEEGRQLIEAAHRKGLLLTVFHNRRWDGDFLTTKRLLSEGILGRVDRFESRFERWRKLPKPGWRLDSAAEAAGGVLFDLGSHLIDQARVLFGPVALVYAELDSRLADSPVDDDAFVALTHSSGVRAHLWMSLVAAQSGPRLRVLGSRAGYTKYGMDVQEKALRNGVSPKAPGWGIDDSNHWGKVGTDEEAHSVETEPGAYPFFYECLLRALRSGTPPPVDPADGVAAVAIIEAARRSAFDGRSISLHPAV